MPLTNALRVIGRAIAGLICVVTLTFAAPAPPAGAVTQVGQATATAALPATFEQGPASSDQLALYARIASVNTCIATRAGQDFEQAAGVAGETIAQLILGVHKGLIATSGETPLSLEDLRKGSINAAVIGATEICPKQVPAALKEKVNQALAEAGSPAAA